MKSAEQIPEGHEEGAPGRGRISSWLGLTRGRSQDLTPEIATRAYQIYQNRVRDDNQQDQDWLQAEEETRNLIRRSRRLIELVVQGAITLGCVFAIFWHDIGAIEEKIISARLEMVSSAISRPSRELHDVALG
jgi:hypothetical protein